jgi:hypothetical protein
MAVGMGHTNKSLQPQLEEEPSRRHLESVTLHSEKSRYGAVWHQGSTLVTGDGLVTGTERNGNCVI